MRCRYPKLFLVGLLVHIAVPLAGRDHVGAVSGGRLSLTAPQRVFSTDLTGPTVGPVPLESFGDVMVYGATQVGEAFVHRCNEAPTVSVVSYGAGEIIHLPIVSAESLCLTTSTPVRIQVTRLGTTSAGPVPGGLQYVPLADPQLLSEGVRTSRPSGESEQLQLTNVPDVAHAAVVLVESYDASGTGEVTSSMVGACPGSINGVTANSPGPGLALGFLPVTGPTATICAWYTGGPFSRVSLLGYLSVDGPDPTRLPPTIGSQVLQALPPGLEPVTPTRVLDTREPIGVDTAGRVPAGGTVELDLWDQTTPTTTSAVLNLAVTEPLADGFVTAYPCDAPRPTAANINFVAGETVSNLVSVKLSADATVCLYTLAASHLVVDLTATYELLSGAGVEPVVPSRLLDTRDGTGSPAGKVAAGHVVELDVTGRGGAPDTGVDAVTLNLAVTEPESPGFITAYPCDSPRPTAANLNFVAGQTVPNAVTVGVSAVGTVCLYTFATTHLVADLGAWYGVANTDGFVALVPDRLLDTRLPIGVPIAHTIPAGGTLTLQVTGRAGVPDDVATAVVMNVAVTGPQLDGFLTIYPCDEPRPLAANLNFDRGETVSNNVTAKLADGGTVCIYAQRETHVVADVAGYFSSELSPVEVFGLVE